MPNSGIALALLTDMLTKLFMFLVLSLSLPSFAQVACYNSHLTLPPYGVVGIRPVVLADVQLPTVAQLKKAGFTIDPKTKIISGSPDKGSKSIEIGQLEIREEPFLYEWAAAKSSKDWIKKGGIEKWELDVFIDQESMAGGRGYYVSSNPTDSKDYGDGLTIFRQKRKFVSLHLYGENYKPRHHKVELTKRLRAAGIDAVRVPGNETWFSVINPELLSNASSHDLNYFAENLSNAKGREHLFNLAIKLSTGVNQKFVGPQTAEINLAKNLSAMVKKLNLEKSPYWAATEIFDIPYVAAIYRDLPIDNPMSVREMVEYANGYAARKKQVDLAQINSFEEFLKAASFIYGKPLEFRDTKAPVLSPLGNTLTPIDEYYLGPAEKNQFLQITKKQDIGDGYFKVEIQHPSVKAYEKFVEDLSAPLVNRIRQLKNSDSASTAALNTQMLQELIAITFNQKKKLNIYQLPIDQYRDFMSIHPFKEGNHIAARLFYEMLILKENSVAVATKKYPLPVLSLPVTGHVYFSYKPNQNLFLGFLLRIWTASAKTDQEFAERNYQALQMLKKSHQTKGSLVDPFPEIGNIK